MNEAELDKLEADIDGEMTTLLNDPNVPLPRKNTMEVLARSWDAIRLLRETLAACGEETSPLIRRARAQNKR